MINRIIVLFSISFVALMLMGCPPKKPLVIEDDEEPSIEDVVDADSDGDATDAPKAIEITQEWAEIPSLLPVTFSYDRSKLGSAQRATLKQNIAIIKKLPSSVMIRVAGHCDDRGTIEYNIALGQRRANTVRSFYKTAGINSSRLKTISFGEERPLCTQPNEACWSKNRRAETQVRNPEPITMAPEEFD